MNKEIKVVVLEPKMKPRVEVIQGDYKGLQQKVDGLIDMVSLPVDDTIDIVCNDEGLLLELEPNIVLPEYGSVLVGTLVFAGYDAETGDTISLDDRQIKNVMTYIKRNQVFNMSIQRAYQYCKIIKDYQESEDAVRGTPLYA